MLQGIVLTRRSRKAEGKTYASSYNSFYCLVRTYFTIYQIKMIGHATLQPFKKTVADSHDEE